ncbi:hemagglutinin repeat-containing protein [Helicobacter sp. 13S00477-4]|uniref:two-partner secretion domain-containing protein n=1 Tax=Helicobacter sp. 13S00477-4 TaxID=1905759 RepID=UPI000BA63D76|nr:hemagglutinin repeat-containing protein [Helicobacter sp. 13S00477-4]PAF50492.1 hypothetical protein BKH44_08025 [Helicobacter sp. 13S00477-4]
MKAKNSYISIRHNKHSTKSLSARSHFMPYIKLAVGLISISLASSLSALDTTTISNPALPKPLPLTPDTTNNAFAPQVIKAHNNIPIVNITTPNAAGISNNAFKDFNVNQNGLIFNNIKDSPSLTQLSGYINSNPNLNHSSTAKLILNQITSSHPSTLLGYMEIGGDKANLIIANPNGITCDGCGFINTANSTMIAGELSKKFNEQFLMMKNMQDALKSLKFLIKDGSINIGAFNGKNLQAINLISRTLSVNGKIDASKITMILGQNNITLDPNNASVLLFQPVSMPTDESVKTQKPALALDVAYMGGVYANSIYLVASEKGVGVKNSGTLATFPSRDGHDGGFIIHSNGDIEITKATREPIVENAQHIEHNTTAPIELNTSTPIIYAGGDLHITAPNIKNQSIIFGEKNISMTTTGNIDNIGQMELESKILSKEHHYSRDGGDDKNSTYDYMTTTTQDELKAGSYHPAIIYAKGSLNLIATLINNTSSIIATPKGELINHSNLNNTTPTPKRTEESVGTRTDYDRTGGKCGVWGFFTVSKWNCHSSTTHHTYHPAPKVSTLSIEDLHIPTIPLEKMMSEYVSTMITNYNATPHTYGIDTDPIYHTPNAFLHTDSFQASISDSALLSAMMDKTDIDNHLNAIQANPFSPTSVGIGITANSAYLLSTPMSDASSLYNTSAIAAGSLYLSSDNITNTNGTIYSSGDMDILAKSFSSDSSKLQANGNININAKDVSIKTTSTSNANALYNCFAIPFINGKNTTRCNTDSTSSNTMLNATSIMRANNIFIDAKNSLSIQGASINTTGNMKLKAKNLKVSIATAKDHYQDNGRTDTSSTQQSSTFHSGGNITLDGSGDLDFSSIDMSADENITFYAGKNLTLDTATNDSYHRLTTTEYSSSKEHSATKATFALTSTTTTTTTEDSSSFNIANTLKAKNISFHSTGNTTAYNLSSKAQDFSIDSGGDTKLSNHADNISQTIHQSIDTIGLYGSAANGKLSLSAGTDHTTSDAHSSWATHHNEAINADHISIVSSRGNVAIESSDLSTSYDGLIALSGDNISVSSLANTAFSDNHSVTKSNRIGISIAAPTGIATSNIGTILGTTALDSTKSLLATGKNIRGLKTISEFGDKLMPGQTLGELGSEIKDDVLHPGVSIGISHTTTTNDAHQSQTFASSSNLSSTNLLIISKEDTHIIGSDLEAKNAYIKAKNLSILSAKNTSNQDSKTNTQSTSLTFSTKIKGKDTGISAELAYQNTDNNTHQNSITHTASKLNIDTLDINTAQSTNIIGSTLNTHTATIQTKEFNLQASQDTEDKRSDTLSYGGSIEASYNGGFDVGVSGNVSQKSDISSSNTYKQSTLNANRLTLIASQASNNTSSINAKHINSTTMIKQAHQDDTTYHTSTSFSQSASAKVGASGLSGEMNFNFKPPKMGEISIALSGNAKPTQEPQKPDISKNLNLGYKKDYWQASTDNIRDFAKKSIEYKDKIMSQSSLKDKFKTSIKKGGDYLGDMYKDLVPDKAKDDINDFATQKAKQAAKWAVQQYDRKTAGSKNSFVKETQDILDKAVGIKK